MAPATSALVDSATLRSVLGYFPTGVVVVTGLGGDGAPAGLTAQSFMSLSVDPPLVLLSVARTSASWPVIAASGRLAVNVLSARQGELALAFARSGAAARKFDGVAWQGGPVTGAPLLDGAVAWIEAEVWQTYDGGDHEIVTARVLNLAAAPDSRHPLLFFRSGFSRLDASPGRSGE